MNYARHHALLAHRMREKEREKTKEKEKKECKIAMPEGPKTLRDYVMAVCCYIPRKSLNCIKNPVVILMLFLAFYLSLVTMAIVMSAKHHPHHKKNRQARVFRVPREFWWREQVWKGVNDTETLNQDKVLYGSNYYDYPLLVDMPELVTRLKNEEPVSTKMVNPPADWVVSSGERCVSVRSDSDDGQDDDNSVDLLLLIRSEPASFQLRQALRRTWANESCYNFTVRTVFIMGNPRTKKLNDDDDVKRRIKLEQAQHGDVAVQDFSDGPENRFVSTYKLIAALNWFREFCAEARFVMTLEETYFVQPGNLFDLLQSFSPAMRRRLVMGWATQDENVIRNPRHQHYIPHKDYIKNQYPKNLGSAVALMSREMAIDISLAVAYTKIFRFDDVFLGLIMYKLLISPIHHRDIVAKPRRQALAPVRQNSGFFPGIILSHGYDTTSILSAWADNKANRGLCLRPNSGPQKWPHHPTPSHMLNDTEDFNSTNSEFIRL